MPDWRIHPEEGDLIRYCDGELRAKQTTRLARHLEACWDCRARLDDLKQVMSEYVHYRRDILNPALPEPPRPWRNLHAEFARMPAPESRWKRIFQRRAVWLIVSAATTGTGILLYTTKEPKPIAPTVAQRQVSVVPPAPAQAPPPVRPSAHKAAPTPEDELRVIAALDRIGAGLGDPIEVARTRERIVVTCMGLNPERAREVHAALAGLPGVTVQLLAKPAAPPAGSPLEVVGAAHASDNEQFADSLLKSSEAIMARAHALHRLAVRFPAAVEAHMSADAKVLLAGIRNSHEAVLASEVSVMARALQPIPSAVKTPDNQDWQSRAMRLFSEAEQVDRLVGAVFAGHRTASASDRSALAAAVARLQADVSY